MLCCVCCSGLQRFRVSNWASIPNGALSRLVICTFVPRRSAKFAQSVFLGVCLHIIVCLSTVKYSDGETLSSARVSVFNLPRWKLDHTPRWQLNRQLEWRNQIVSLLLDYICFFSNKYVNRSARSWAQSCFSLVASNKFFIGIRTLVLEDLLWYQVLAPFTDSVSLIWLTRAQG